MGAVDQPVHERTGMGPNIPSTLAPEPHTHNQTACRGVQVFTAPLIHDHDSDVTHVEHGGETHQQLSAVQPYVHVPLHGLGIQPHSTTDSQCPRSNPDLSPPFRTFVSDEGLVAGPHFSGKGGERDTCTLLLAKLKCNENSFSNDHAEHGSNSSRGEHADPKRHIEQDQLRGETMHVHVHHGRDTRVNAPPVDAMSLHDDHDDDSQRAVDGGRRGELGRSALDMSVGDHGVASALAYHPTTTAPLSYEAALQGNRDTAMEGEATANATMACVETEGRSIPLDDATVRTHDHAVPGRIKDCESQEREQGYPPSCLIDCDPEDPLSRGGAGEFPNGLSSDTEPRRDTLPKRVHENEGPRARDRSNSHAQGGVPLPRGSGATSSENAGPRAHDRSHMMGSSDSVQHSCKDVHENSTIKSNIHLREVTPSRVPMTQRNPP